MNNIEARWIEKKSQFIELWPRNNPQKIEKIWTTLTSYYCEKTRHYHSCEHILKCLEQFDSIQNLLISGDAVQMSIWFHDAIYNVNVNDNEEQSALFFSQIATGLLNPQFIKQVADLIVSTKHLKAPPNCDQAYLLDIDLSSFGTSQHIFHLNWLKLRKEVPHLTDKQYTDKQIAFFKMLLNREQIFFTDYFHNKYEVIARQNINHKMQDMIKTG